ncbi:unnamed protein product [Moneuplotes crassus]|uniref:Uncharacterized protein n=1 Tax=Euplotes crassus TaxID=5936 RepID=A0AAD1U966_EUPCR|nr:unnamed protein product [Moneuplotes crassus]
MKVTMIIPKNFSKFELFSINKLERNISSNFNLLNCLSFIIP